MAEAQPFAHGEPLSPLVLGQAPAEAGQATAATACVLCCPGPGVEPDFSTWARPGVRCRPPFRSDDSLRMSLLWATDGWVGWERRGRRPLLPDPPYLARWTALGRRPRRMDNVVPLAIVGFAPSNHVVRCRLVPGVQVHALLQSHWRAKHAAQPWSALRDSALQR